MCLACLSVQDIVSLQSFSVRVHHPVIALLHLQSPPDCNTIVRPLRNIYGHLPTPPPVYAIHHIILVMAISCKGQDQDEMEE